MRLIFLLIIILNIGYAQNPFAGPPVKTNESEQIQEVKEEIPLIELPEFKPFETIEPFFTKEEIEPLKPYVDVVKIDFPLSYTYPKTSFEFGLFEITYSPPGKLTKLAYQEPISEIEENPEPEIRYLGFLSGSKKVALISYQDKTISVTEGSKIEDIFIRKINPESLEISYLQEIFVISIQTEKTELPEENNNGEEN